MYKLIVDHILMELLEGWPHFLGGSQRFGFNTKDSDYDIFILDPNNTFKVPGWADDTYNGFGPYDDESVTIYKYMVGNNHIHFIVMRREEIFDEIKRDHDLIAENMTDELRRVVREMPVSGVTKYRVLLKLAKEIRISQF